MTKKTTIEGGTVAPIDGTIAFRLHIDHLCYPQGHNPKPDTTPPKYNIRGQSQKEVEEGIARQEAAEAEATKKKAGQSQ